MTGLSIKEKIDAYEAQLQLPPEELAALRAGRLVLAQTAVVNNAMEKRDGSDAAEAIYCAAVKELIYRQRVVRDLEEGGFMAGITIQEYAPLERAYITQQIAALNRSSLEG